MSHRPFPIPSGGLHSSALRASPVFFTNQNVQSLQNKLGAGSQSKVNSLAEGSVAVPSAGHWVTQNNGQN